MPFPLFIAALVVYVGVLLVAAWRMLGDQEWVYARKPLFHRIAYFAVFLTIWVGVPIWMLAGAE